MIFGKGKDECWICRRKVSESGIFLTSDDLGEIFDGIFKDFQVSEEFKNICVCEVCAGIAKILASESVQTKMAISKVKVDVKDRIGKGKEKIGGLLRRK